MSPILLSRIHFTDACEQILAMPVRADAFSVLHKDIICKRESLIVQCRTELSKAYRRMIKTLITLNFEQLQIIEDLMASDDPQAIWENELRFYSQADGTVSARCGQHAIVVGDDFPGRQMLVVTRLTREARTQFFASMNNKAIYAPNGPAGTGKTETIKDTCRALGMDAPVINVSEQIMEVPKEVVEKAASQGVLCPIIFDDFNRVPASQMEALIASCKGQSLCVTFNPSLSEGTRVEDFPLTVRKMIKEHTFTRPDLVEIMAVLLACAGVRDCDRLSKGLSACLQVCESSVSKQAHYDFGLRFIKSLCRQVGSLMALAELDGEVVDEGKMVGNVLLTLLFARCTPRDRLVVTAEVKDKFPGAEIPSDWLANSKEAAPSTTAMMACFALQGRHGVAVVGCPREAVDACLAFINERVNFSRSIEVKHDAGEDIFGDDGAFLRALKNVKHQANDEKVNLVLRMPLTKYDLAHLHTVLDDNKVFLTPSGERHQLTPNIRILFFAESCEEWSPAAVSRVGVVHYTWEPTKSVKMYAMPLLPALDIQDGPAAGTITEVPATIKLTIKGSSYRRPALNSMDELWDWIATVHVIEVSPAYETKLFWIDDEDDVIILANDADLAEALRFTSVHTPHKALRIFLTYKKSTH